MQVGEAVFPVLRLTENEILLEAGMAPRLRGLVDVYDGARHILQALIIATTEENGRLVCSFKRSNTVRDSAPLDYERDEDAPVGYLPKA